MDFTFFATNGIVKEKKSNFFDRQQMYSNQKQKLKNKVMPLDGCFGTRVRWQWLFGDTFVLFVIY